MSLLLAHRGQLATRALGGPPEHSPLSFRGCIRAGVAHFDQDVQVFASDDGTLDADVFGRTRTYGPVLRHDNYAIGGWTSSTGDIAYASIPDNTLTLAQHMALDIGSPNGASYGGWHPLSLVYSARLAVIHGLTLHVQPPAANASATAQILREIGLPPSQIVVLGFSSADALAFRNAFGDGVRILTAISQTTASTAIPTLAGLRNYGTSMVSLPTAMSAVDQVAVIAAAHAVGMQVRAWDDSTDANKVMSLIAGGADIVAADSIAIARGLILSASGLADVDTDGDGANDYREYLTGVSVGDSRYLPSDIWEEQETVPGDGPRMFRGRLVPSAASETAGRPVCPWLQWSLDGSTWVDMPESRVILRFPIPSDPVWQLTANLAGNSYPVRLSARDWVTSYP